MESEHKPPVLTRGHHFFNAASSEPLLGREILTMPTPGTIHCVSVNCWRIGTIATPRIDVAARCSLSSRRRFRQAH